VLLYIINMPPCEATKGEAACVANEACEYYAGAEMCVQIIKRTDYLSEYAGAWRATRNSYLKALNELTMSIAPYKAASIAVTAATDYATTENPNAINDAKRQASGGLLNGRTRANKYKYHVLIICILAFAIGCNVILSSFILMQNS
jgi:hypothetical protein